MNSPEKSSNASAGSSQELPLPRRIARRLAPSPATLAAIARKEKEKDKEKKGKEEDDEGEGEGEGEDFFDRSTDMVERIRKLRQAAEKKMRQIGRPANYTVEHLCGKAAPTQAEPNAPSGSTACGADGPGTEAKKGNGGNEGNERNEGNEGNGGNAGNGGTRFGGQKMGDENL
jgi:hypothetical protein